MNPRFDDLVVTHWGARFQGRCFPCSIGRGGIGIKGGEGDGITPAGCFHLVGSGFRSDRLQFHSSKFIARPIALNDIWSDDPNDPDYNHGLRSISHPFSFEALRRPDPLYDAFGVLDYNWPNAIPGKGSAIFLHVWRKPRHRTEGCVAFAQNDLLNIFTRWTVRSRVIIRG